MKKKLLNEAVKLESFYQGRALQYTLAALLWITENAEEGEIKERAANAIVEYQAVIQENFDRQQQLFKGLVNE